MATAINEPIETVKSWLSVLGQDEQINGYRIIANGRFVTVHIRKSKHSNRFDVVVIFTSYGDSHTFEYVSLELGLVIEQMESLNIHAFDKMELNNE